MDIFRNQTQSNWTKRIIIVGGGLVGSLQALFFAQKGYLVDIYEIRDNNLITLDGLSILHYPNVAWLL